MASVGKVTVAISTIVIKPKYGKKDIKIICPKNSAVTSLIVNIMTKVEK